MILHCLLSFSAFIWYAGCYFIFRGVVFWKIGHNHSAGTVSDIAVKLVSTCQALMTVAVGLRTIDACDDLMKDRYWLLSYYVSFSWPYFLYDTWAMWRTHVLDNAVRLAGKSLRQQVADYALTDRSMFLHHTVLPCILYPVFIYGFNGRGEYFVGCFLLFDVSSPFVLFRAILLRLKKKETVLYTVVSLFMVVAFFIFRILIFPFLYYRYATYSRLPVLRVPANIPLKCNLANVLLFSFQAYWFRLMIKGLLRAIRKWTKTKAECQ